MAQPHSDTRRILALLAPAWLALAWFVSEAQWFWNNRPDLQFGWIVLLLSAFLIWDRWAQRPPIRLKATLPTLLLAAGAFAVLFLYQLFQAAFGMLSSALFLLAAGALGIVAANIHYLFGSPGLRFYAFPFLFLLIALPLPSGIYNPLVSTLQSQIASLNVELLTVFGVPAERVGSLIQLPNGMVGVDEACSGIRSLQSTVMATLFIGYLTLKRFSLQAMLFVCGVGFAFMGNVIRSLYLSLTANARGVDSIAAVHDTAGWSILLFTAVGVALIAWVLAKAEKWMEQQEQVIPTVPEKLPAGETVA